MADKLGICSPCFVEGLLPLELKMLSVFENILGMCLLLLKKQILANTFKVSEFSSCLTCVTNKLLEISLRSHVKDTKQAED